MFFRFQVFIVIAYTEVLCAANEKFLSVSLWNEEESTHDNVSFISDDIVVTGRTLRYRKHCATGNYSVEKCEMYRESRIWPPHLLVAFSEKRVFSTEQKDAIKRVLDDLVQHTCLSIAYVSEDLDPLNTILIQHGVVTGCWAYYGKLSQEGMEFGGVINLATHCLSYGIILHETMHALGFTHEHCRLDRNEYVTIHLENLRQDIPADTIAANFGITTDPIFKTLPPYDYGSVMQYGPRAFSKTGLDSISPNDNGYRVVMGQTVRAAFSDWKRINMAYCGASDEGCLNAGYRNKGMDKCVCQDMPPGPVEDRGDCEYNQWTIDDSLCWHKLMRHGYCHISVHHLAERFMHRRVTMLLSSTAWSYIHSFGLKTLYNIEINVTDSEPCDDRHCMWNYLEVKQVQYTQPKGSYEEWTSSVGKRVCCQGESLVFSYGKGVRQDVTVSSYRDERMTQTYSLRMIP